MRYIKFVDGVQWNGYLQAHETMRGFSCFICNDERFERTPLTYVAADAFHLGLPEDYRYNYKTRESAEAMLQRVATINGFSKIEDNI